MLFSRTYIGSCNDKMYQWFLCEKQTSDWSLWEPSALKMHSIHLSFFISFLSFCTSYDDIRYSVSQLGSRSSVTLPHSVKGEKYHRLVTVFFMNDKQVLFHEIYQTRETVFHRDIHTLRRELKIRHTAEYFWWNPRCLDSRRNTVTCLMYLLNWNKND